MAVNRKRETHVIPDLAAAREKGVAVRLKVNSVGGALENDCSFIYASTKVRVSAGDLTRT